MKLKFDDGWTVNSNLDNRLQIVVIPLIEYEFEPSVNVLLVILRNLIWEPCTLQLGAFTLIIYTPGSNVQGSQIRLRIPYL